MVHSLPNQNQTRLQIYSSLNQSMHRQQVEHQYQELQRADLQQNQRLQILGVLLLLQHHLELQHLLSHLQPQQHLLGQLLLQLPHQAKHQNLLKVI